MNLLDEIPEITWSPLLNKHPYLPTLLPLTLVALSLKMLEENEDDFDADEVVGHLDLVAIES